MSSSSGFYGAVRLTHRLVLVYGFISNHAGLLKVPLRLLYEQPGLLFNPPQHWSEVLSLLFKPPGLVYESLVVLYKTPIQLYDTAGLLSLPSGAIFEPTGPLY